MRRSINQIQNIFDQLLFLVLSCLQSAICPTSPGELVKIDLLNWKLVKIDLLNWKSASRSFLLGIQSKPCPLMIFQKTPILDSTESSTSLADQDQRNRPFHSWIVLKTVERETETVQNPLTEPQNRLTGPQSLQQATELQSQATVHHLPTTGLQNLPTVSLGRDSLHPVLGKFFGISMIQGHLHTCSGTVPPLGIRSRTSLSLPRSTATPRLKAWHSRLDQVQKQQIES